LRILVIAAHPDDEVLGMGATIKKLTSKKNDVSLCVVTEGVTAQYRDKKMIEIRKESCKNAGKILGISKFYFLEFPDMKLDTIPHLEINRKLEKVIKTTNPEMVFTVSDNDLNKDHQIVYESTLIVTRPHKTKIKSVLAYEIPGLSKNPFVPNFYEDITKFFDFKVNAFKKYYTEIQKYPLPRSIENIENWAKIKGMESNFNKAEAFKIIRSMSK
jgi:N-acetylglucosamine malate deacetylase 1